MASSEIVIPKIWETLKSEGPNEGLSGLINIWQSRLRTAKSEDESTPRTILCVTFMKMVNLIPQDAPHPLYSSDCYEQTDSFILDHLCMDEVDFEDETLNEAEGVTVKTMSGKDVIFKKNKEDGKITANGIEVENIKTLSDGTKGVILKNFLFDHYEDTQKAFRKVSANITNEFCPLSNP